MYLEHFIRIGQLVYPAQTCLERANTHSKRRKILIVNEWALAREYTSLIFRKLSSDACTIEIARVERKRMEE